MFFFQYQLLVTLFVQDPVPSSQGLAVSFARVVIDTIRYYGRMVWRVCLCDPIKSITCIGMFRWILEESIFQCLYFQPLRSWFNLTNQRKGGTYVSENICTPSPLWTCWVFSKNMWHIPNIPGEVRWYRNIHQVVDITVFVYHLD